MICVKAKLCSHHVSSLRRVQLSEIVGEVCRSLVCTRRTGRDLHRNGRIDEQRLERINDVQNNSHGFRLDAADGDI